MAKTSKNKKPEELKLEDVLMECRNCLRSNSSMTTKRDVILTLVFLKFIGAKFYRQQEKIRADLESRNIPSNTIESLLEQPYFYQKDGVFYLPADCRWEMLLSTDSAKLALTIDSILAKLDAENESLKGALPMKLFTDSQIDGSSFKSLINEVNKISEERFHEKDLIGRVYEYFLQAFSINADREEGEFYTPHSVVELICDLIEPYDGTIYDPCCGAGGMFVQAAKFVEAHGGNKNTVQVYGQESQPETYRLAKMNLAVRGISYDLGSTAASTFTNDQHNNLKVSYIMANPPFNLKKWRSENELVTDVRWSGYAVPPESNANYAWILHILSKLDASNGVAGFLLSNGALDDAKDNAYAIRRKLIENDKVEAIMVLPRGMFYSTDISVTLWILNQNKKGGLYHNRQLRDRSGEILFVDLRSWKQNIYEGNHVQFLPEQIMQVAQIYQTWQGIGTDGATYAKPELYRSVSLNEIADNNFSLVPSRYIEFVDRDQDIDYEGIMRDTVPVVANLLQRQAANQEALKQAFKELGYEL